MRWTCARLPGSCPWWSWVSAPGAWALWCACPGPYALLEQRDYVVPEDVQAVFSDVCAHRLVLRPQARVEGVTSQDLLTEVLRQVPPPSAPRWPHA